MPVFEIPAVIFIGVTAFKLDLQASSDVISSYRLSNFLSHIKSTL